MTFLSKGIWHDNIFFFNAFYEGYDSQYFFLKEKIEFLQCKKETSEKLSFSYLSVTNTPEQTTEKCVLR